MRPFGYFVHHQGRGHAERCAALIDALPPGRPVTVFCADPAMLPPLPPQAEVVRLPSLFEPAAGTQAHPGLDAVPTPDTLHCAPLGWGGIRDATATLTRWFATADPALMIVDVSAEIAQLCRICSVPHVKVLQHGDRSDPGHRAAYEGAAGLLAPVHADLAQPDWDDEMRDRTHFAPGLAVDSRSPDRDEARARLGLADDDTLVLAVSGAGGGGLASAALGVGARATPRWRWQAIGAVQPDWHATLPTNLVLAGWVDDAAVRIAAADVVISHAGNTLCHQVLAAGRPWIVVPQWRYFDEQKCKGECLARAGVAHVLADLPSSAGAWRTALDEARAAHDADRQRALVDPNAAAGAALWLEDLAERLWRVTPHRRAAGVTTLPLPAPFPPRTGAA